MPPRVGRGPEKSNDPDTCVALKCMNTSKSRLAVDREFMYIGSAGPGPGGRAEGRADGRSDGRAAGLILNDSTTMFIDFGRGDQIVHIFVKHTELKKV